MSDIFNRLAMAAKAADELPAIISEINALLPDGWEVRRCVEHVAGGTKPVFKVGQKWKRRDGSITSIKAVTDGEDYPVTCSIGRMYSKSGFWLKSRESDIDLVELIEDAPK